MDIKIFWCRVNKYFAQKWAASIVWNSKKNTEKNILIASCVVTDRAKKKFVKEVKKCVNSWNTIYLTWCWAFSKWWKVNETLFFSTYEQLVPFKENIVLLPESPKKWEWDFDAGLYTKKFVVVQLGCDNSCTYCLTTKKRWNHKNKNIWEILKEIKYLETCGAKEIVLTWINLWAWWSKSTFEYPNDNFVDLLSTILQKTTIPRIRLSSLSPEYITDKWLDVLSDKRVLAYFHLSLQSWSSKILSLMWRHYDRQLLENLIQKLYSLKKDVPINIWADIIVWFPQETEKEFLETYDMIKDYKLSKLHVFPFSSHMYGDTVFAGGMEWQIDNETKKQRENQILDIWNKNYNDLKLQTVWKEVNILVEDNNSWLTQNYIRMDLDWNYKKWDIVKVVYK